MKENFYYLNNRYLTKVLLLDFLDHLKIEFLPLFEICPRKYWTNFNLYSFFIGGPGKKNSLDKTDIGKRNLFLKKYFKKIDEIVSVTDEHFFISIFEYILNILEYRRVTELEEILEIKDTKQRILFSTFLLDIAEKICTTSSYVATQDYFVGIFFPFFYKRAKSIIDNRMQHIGYEKGLNSLLVKVNKDLKLYSKGKIYAVTARIMIPSGLCKESLKYKFTKKKILGSDFVSFNILYTNRYRYFPDVVNDLENFLKLNFGSKIIRDDKVKGRYRGTHFYVNYKNVPLEFKVRNMKSDLSLIEKKRYRILERRNLRYILL